MPNELMLVGSIPLDTVQEVFETFGKPLGKYLFAMPDGEVGPRRHWISRVHYQVLSGHQDLGHLRRPEPDETASNGCSRARRAIAGCSRSRICGEAGPASAIRAGGLGYARDAISYVLCVQRPEEKRYSGPRTCVSSVSIPMVNQAFCCRAFSQT